MRAGLITIFILLAVSSSFGQDGSSMKYVKPRELNDSFIGRRMHLDFSRISRMAVDRVDPEKWDTVLIEVRGRKIKFIEHRVDDGLNNWFHKQYLESIDEIEGLKLRITQFELLKINEKDVSVKAFLAYFDKNGK